MKNFIVARHTTVKAGYTPQVDVVITDIVRATSVIKAVAAATGIAASDLRKYGRETVEAYLPNKGGAMRWTVKATSNPGCYRVGETFR